MNTDKVCPKEITFDSLVVDISCHPTRDVIAAGDIDGDIAVYSYSTQENNHLLLELKHHRKAIRALSFSPDGTKLLSASKDKSLQVVDIDQGKVINAIEKAHKSPLYSLLPVDNNIIASGDDDGTVKVWDLRTKKAVMDLQECEDFISDMVIDNRRRVMLATSGDGSLTAYDIRHHKLKLKSESFDAEFLSLAIIKNEKNVVCGTGDGVLNIFNWNEWGFISDKFPGHPLSIDCILPISPDIVLTGSMDGYIRAIHLLPNRLMGIVGKHKKLPVENLSLSHCRKYVASCSHDQKVKFWNIEGIADQSADAREKPRFTMKQPVEKAATSDFFADLADPPPTENKESEEDSSGDDSDGSDDESGGEDKEGADMDNEHDEEGGGLVDDDSEGSESEEDSDNDKSGESDDAKGSGVSDNEINEEEQKSDDSNDET